MFVVGKHELPDSIKQYAQLLNGRRTSCVTWQPGGPASEYRKAAATWILADVVDNEFDNIGDPGAIGHGRGGRDQSIITQ
jgi:hypothetical protein